MRISVDGRRIRNNKVAFSNLSGIVWTGPKFQFIFQVSYYSTFTTIFGKNCKR